MERTRPYKRNPELERRIKAKVRELEIIRRASFDDEADRQAQLDVINKELDALQEERGGPMRHVGVFGIGGERIIRPEE